MSARRQTNGLHPPEHSLLPSVLRPRQDLAAACQGSLTLPQMLALQHQTPRLGLILMLLCLMLRGLRLLFLMLLCLMLRGLRLLFLMLLGPILNGLRLLFLMLTLSRLLQ